MKAPLWQPSEEIIKQSNMTAYENWLAENKHLSFQNYEELWQWSVDNIADFWESIWHFFDIKSYQNYDKVLEKPSSEMIGTKWFSGSTLNYAEHIFRNKSDKYPAIIYQTETQELTEISWQELENSVKNLQQHLLTLGIQKGDRIVGYLPNTPEAIIAFLAVNSLGGIWSCCSPDFGLDSILDRFQQIEPKILIASKGYSYNGKYFDKSLIINELINNLPSLKETIITENTTWQNIISTTINEPLTFTPVEFEHPIWILYSSGTTGKPKAITHSTGGNLLEHLKAVSLHQNCKAGERFFWYSTTGWMMWNYALASMLAGCTLCLYDGSPAYPTMNILWDFAENAKVNHFGAGAAFYISCMKSPLAPRGGTAPLQSSPLLVPPLGGRGLLTIGSTGSPLPSETFRWIYETFDKSVHLISLSGGTDVCSAFVGGCPTLPVYEGEIQCRMLGAKIEAWNDEGKPVYNEVGELMITEPMPSMPIYFWNDMQNERYKNSYFEKYPAVWCHGDWIKITENKGVIIYGRSDATLNRDGVRIGTAEIYSAVESLPEIKDSLVICLEKENGDFYMPLFIQLAENELLNEDLEKKIKQILRQKYSPRHVPDAIFEVSEIPYTISGKKMEMPIKKILMGVSLEKAITLDAMKNPSSVQWFLDFDKRINHKLRSE